MKSQDSSSLQVRDLGTLCTAVIPTGELGVSAARRRAVKRTVAGSGGAGVKGAVLLFLETQRFLGVRLALFLVLV